MSQENVSTAVAEKKPLFSRSSFEEDMRTFHRIQQGHQPEEPFDNYHNISLFPEAAEAIHGQLVDEINSLASLDVKKIPAYRSNYHIGGNLVCDDSGKRRLINIDTDLTEPGFENMCIFNYAILNQGKIIFPEDMLRGAIAHEYGHSILFENYDEEINEIAKIVGRGDEKEMKSFWIALHEGFAFYFSEDVTGIRKISKEVISRYIMSNDLRRNRSYYFNGDLMREFYMMFKTVSEEKGVGYVVDNLPDLLQHRSFRDSKHVEIPSMNDIMEYAKKPLACELRSEGKLTDYHQKPSCMLGGGCTYPAR